MPAAKRTSSAANEAAADIKPNMMETGSEDVNPSKKKKVTENGSGKPKLSNGSESVSAAEIETNDQGESFIKLSEYRRITVREFKGKTLVDIREVYKDKATGSMKPGAKGISLTSEQWEVLKANFGQIDEMASKITSK